MMSGGGAGPHIVGSRVNTTTGHTGAEFASGSLHRRGSKTEGESVPVFRTFRNIVLSNHRCSERSVYLASLAVRAYVAYCSVVPRGCNNSRGGSGTEKNGTILHKAGLGYSFLLPSPPTGTRSTRRTYRLLIFDPHLGFVIIVWFIQ